MRLFGRIRIEADEVTVIPIGKSKSVYEGPAYFDVVVEGNTPEDLVADVANKLGVQIQFKSKDFCGAV